MVVQAIDTRKWRFGWVASFMHGHKLLVRVDDSIVLWMSLVITKQGNTVSWKSI